MCTFDLERFRRTHPDQLQPPKAKRRRPRPTTEEWFLKGPIPGRWLKRAASLPGRALHVGLAVWVAAAMKQSNRAKLTWRHLARFGVLHDAGRRGLLALERAGLVFAERHTGRCPVVTILEAR
jgi:hypothetical protein